MIAPLLNELLALLVRGLPRFFLLGAPFLAFAIALAAFVDTKLPRSSREV
jgi:hypothetical protein